MGCTGIISVSTLDRIITIPVSYTHLLRVTDTGQGMTEERLREVQNAIETGERTGFGLAAVSERIRLYYGADYGLKISSKEGKGTVMEVYLAKKMQSKDAS